MLKKDDEVIITIESMGTEGEGIGRYEGLTLFVKDAVKGDKVRVKVMKMKKTYGYARLMEIIESSQFRVEPRCPVARQCGGCTIQHVDYDYQLKFKEDKVIDCLERIGGINNAREYMEPIVGMEHPWYYRNKAQFPVGRGKDGSVKIGFYAGHSHNIIDMTNCMIQDKANTPIIKAIKELINEFPEELEPYNEEKNTGVLRHIVTRVAAATDDAMVCLVINKDDLSNKVKNAIVEKLRAALGRISSICLNVNKKNTNVILGDKIINVYGNAYITDYIGDVKFEISPLSFFQVNPVQTKHLYDIALEYASLSGNENVWDLYCGIGTISLFLAKNAGHVMGVEIVPEAINDAKRNAEINGINNVDFYVGSAQEVVPAMYKENNGACRADVVVVDPPRKGCDVKLLETLVEMNPERIVYVSCDPATLARDVAWLGEQGYELKKFRCVDMFGMSGHVETVFLLSQRKADGYVEVELELDELDVTRAESKDYILKE